MTSATMLCHSLPMTLLWVHRYRQSSSVILLAMVSSSPDRVARERSHFGDLDRSSIDQKRHISQSSGTDVYQTGFPTLIRRHSPNASEYVENPYFGQDPTSPQVARELHFPKYGPPTEPVVSGSRDKVNPFDTCPGPSLEHVTLALQRNCNIRTSRLRPETIDNQMDRSQARSSATLQHTSKGSDSASQVETSRAFDQRTGYRSDAINGEHLECYLCQREKYMNDNINCD